MLFEHPKINKCLTLSKNAPFINNDKTEKIIGKSIKKLIMYKYTVSENL